MDQSILDDTELAEMSEFVKKHLGLYFPPEKYDDLKRGVDILTTKMGFLNPSACLKWIFSSHLDQSLIEMLAVSLAVGETYFFREPDVFDIVEKIILPEIISKRRDNGRFIRIWCAACSTGEEAYTIAILLTKIIPDIKDWSITIYGTDINPEALKIAKVGIYRKWSFRSTSLSVQQRYFHAVSDERYEISSDIKKLVTFSYLNLVKDNYPVQFTHSNDIDLIFCRSVLMYFSKETIIDTIKKLQQCLIPDGRLIVSMTETIFIQHPNLLSEVTRGITIFRKTDTTNPHSIQEVRINDEILQKTYLPGSALLPTPDTPDYNQVNTAGGITFDTEKKPKIDIPAILQLSGSAKNNAYDTAVRLYDSGDYEEVEKILLPFITVNPDNHHAIAFMALIMANQGNLYTAQSWCERAIALDKLNPSYHHLLSMIFQEEGDIDAAIRELHQVLNADPSYVTAHFSLASIRYSQGNIEEAGVHFKNANELLRILKPKKIIKDTREVDAVSIRDKFRSIISGEQVS